jgi:hypothetical protein
VLLLLLLLLLLLRRAPGGRVTSVRKLQYVHELKHSYVGTIVKLGE